MGAMVSNEAIEVIDAMRARGACRVHVSDGTTTVTVDFPASAPIVVAEGAMRHLVAPAPLGVPLPVKTKPKDEKEEAADYDRVLFGSAKP
jgi:hypothetical protein